jgi:ankyrin repeat protein
MPTLIEDANDFSETIEFLRGSYYIPTGLDFMLSCESGNADEVVSYLNDGIIDDVNWCNSCGETALMWACIRGHQHIVKILLEAGADPNITNEGDVYSSVMLAIKFRELEIVKMLMPLASQPESPMYLSVAVLYDHPVIARFLYEFGSEITSEMLTTAVHQSGTEIIHWLLDLGVDPNWRSQFERTPLIDACLIRNRETVTILLDRGADINLVDIAGESALFHASGSCDVQTIRLLLSRGAKVDQANEYGFTPLMHAVSRHRVRVAHLLLSYGADPSIQNFEGQTAQDMIPNYCFKRLKRYFKAVTPEFTADLTRRCLERAELVLASQGIVDPYLRLRLGYSLYIAEHPIPAQVPTRWYPRDEYDLL